MLRSLWTETGETVALMLRQGDVRVCAAEIPSAQPLSFKRGIGHSVNVSIGASGRAILAFAEDADWYSDKIVEPQDRAGYRSKLERVRKDGYAVSRDELIEGAVAVAVPFFDAKHTVAGSLAVFGPSVRVGKPQVDRIASLLLQQSQALSKVLGGHGGT
jgi:DNA-binding IclR family transcriptional regulator